MAKRTNRSAVALSSARRHIGGNGGRGQIGTVWGDDELDALVADYFGMHEVELSGHRYVKAHHSAALMAQIGSTYRAVEFKHQNMSAAIVSMRFGIQTATR
jgi:hypothetical protein